MVTTLAGYVVAVEEWVIPTDAIHTRLYAYSLVPSDWLCHYFVVDPATNRVMQIGETIEGWQLANRRQSETSFWGGPAIRLGFQRGTERAQTN